MKVSPSVKKLEKKLEKKLKKPRTTKITTTGLWSKLVSVGNKMMSSKVLLDTPFGRLGAGLNGLTYSEPGAQNLEGEVTNGRSGKRTYYYTHAAPPWKGYKNGVRVIAAQTLCTVGTANASVNLLNNAASDAIRLNPDVIGGQMALDARNYNRWICREIVAEYVPNVAVGYTTAGIQNFVFAYSADPAIGNFQTLTYNSCQAINDNSDFQIWRPGFLAVRPLIDNLLFTEDDTTDSNSIRSCSQGEFRAVAQNAATATATNLGSIIIHYIMDLYDRASDYGFTIMISDREREREVLKMIYEHDSSLLPPREKRKLLSFYRPKEPVSSIDLDLLSLVPAEEVKESKEFDVRSIKSVKRSL